MKSNSGHFFEDFTLGRVLTHATPLTVSAGDILLYRALTGERQALYSSEPFSGMVDGYTPVSYTRLLAHETREDLVCRLLLEKKK